MYVQGRFVRSASFFWVHPQQLQYPLAKPELDCLHGPELSYAPRDYEYYFGLVVNSKIEALFSL